ncbi:uncharacterized protein EI90DRAFT_2946067, partial [Cantharellus anzutake]|uniref:uncharacterized protein n=1 Tax=Cantharellus anzutake TaxID=1750568 RepID=UPI0019063CA5
YKAQQQISALVTKRGKSLQSTLQKYNTLVATMNPPKPSLTWTQVTDLNFLSNIVILWGREDMQEKPWFKHHFRDAMHAWYKLQRPREEIEIIGLEAHRIWASIHQEEAHLDQVIKDTQLTDPELSKYITYF